jgi:excisionase family DNA binding protein
MINVERYLSAAEAAAVLGIHPRTLLRAAASGEVPGKRVGSRMWRFLPSQLNEWFRAKGAK